jgi:hypothetical protein
LADVPKLIQDGLLTDGPSLTGLAVVTAFGDLNDRP